MYTNTEKVAITLALLNEFCILKAEYRDTGEADMEGVAVAICELTDTIPEDSVNVAELPDMYYNGLEVVKEFIES